MLAFIRKVIEGKCWDLMMQLYTSVARLHLENWMPSAHPVTGSVAFIGKGAKWIHQVVTRACGLEWLDRLRPFTSEHRRPSDKLPD